MKNCFSLKISRMQRLRKRDISVVFFINNFFPKKTTKIKTTTADVTNRFDRVFWFGDFNFRIQKSRDTVDRIMGRFARNQPMIIRDLLQHDQLNEIFERGKIFHGFAESDIRFMPTYKFDVNTDTYDTSHKKRVPSWTVSLYLYLFVFHLFDFPCGLFARCRSFSSRHLFITSSFHYPLPTTAPDFSYLKNLKDSKLTQVHDASNTRLSVFSFQKRTTFR